METINLKNPADWDNLDEIINTAASVIKRGGSFVFPTDTVYGLGVDALREDSVERLFKIKKRPSTKPVPIIVKDIEMVRKLAYTDKRIENFLKKVWPGPVTIVLEKRSIIPDTLTANKRTVGLRIPDSQFVKALMEKIDKPITATSANFSGKPPLTYSIEIIKAFEKAYPRPDLFIDAGDLKNIPPSTVMDLTGEKPKILRIGPVNKKQLMNLFKN